MCAGRKKIEDNFKCPHNRLSQLVVVVVLERCSASQDVRSQRSQLRSVSLMIWALGHALIPY